jgi:heme-degrading monooxygenase HmoA
MPQAIMIRVHPEDYERWLREHTGQAEARRAFGITDGPFYRDANDPTAVLVHLNVEEKDRAMQWFRSDAFREAARRAGAVKREIWIAEQPGRTG